MRLSFDYFVDWAVTCAAGLVGPDEFEWDARLELELPNIRRCYEWSAARNSWADVCALLGPYAAAGFGSGMRLAAWPLDVIEDLANSGELLAGRVMANAATTWPAEAVGTIELLDRAQKVAANNGDESCIAYWLYQAFSAGTEERAPVVIERTDEMVSRALGLGELTPATGCLTGRALAKVTLGLGGAEADARRAYEIARESGNPSTVGIGCFALTHALRATDPEAALEAVQEGLDICGEGPIGAVLDNDLALLLIVLDREEELMEHVAARLGFAPQAAGVSALAAATVPALVRHGEVELAVDVVSSTAPYLIVLSQYRPIFDRALEALPPGTVVPEEAGADPEEVRDRLVAWLDADWAAPDGH